MSIERGMKNLLLSTVIGLAALLVGGPAAAVIAVAVVGPAATAIAA
jgi:hypothetical protein